MSLDSVSAQAVVVVMPLVGVLTGVVDVLELELELELEVPG